MNACSVYDFRYSADIDGSRVSHETIVSRLKGIAKKYVFQLEKGDTGYVHYQGRMSLIKKRRKPELLSLFGGLAPNYLEPTCTREYLTGDMFYQMKLDTRIGGPWKDDDVVIYIPRQIRLIEHLRPFQQTIIERLDEWDTRTINVVYDTSGCIGKSTLVGYCRAHQLARCLPTVTDCKDMMRMVCDMPTAASYIIDMPRSMNKERLGGFYSAIEMLKDGYAYDDRYSFKEKVFDCPNIWIFTNDLPCTSYASRDRWKVWCISDDYKLVKYVPPPLVAAVCATFHKALDVIVVEPAEPAQPTRPSPFATEF